MFETIVSNNCLVGQLDLDFSSWCVGGGLPLEGSDKNPTLERDSSVSMGTASPHCSSPGDGR